MKIKLLTMAALTFTSFSAFGLPASEDELIRALINDGKLSAALKVEKSPIKSVQITRVGFNELRSLEAFCGNEVLSKSAAGLKVELVYFKSGGIENSAYSSSAYFATPGAAANLKLCDGK